MLYVFSTLFVVALALAIYAYRAKQTRLMLQSRFNQVIGLRQLIHLLRFHRRQTHQWLNIHLNTTTGSPPAQPEPPALAESRAIKNLIQSLTNLAEPSNRPMYRILAKRLHNLLEEWPSYSLQRNQVEHGKLIRHVLYLIDDTITQSLIAAEQNHIFNHYQAVWPVTLNAIDSLSRFRYTIHNFSVGSPAMERELRLHLQILKRRLGQMTLPIHEPVPPLILDTLFGQFDDIPLYVADEDQVRDALYQFSQQVSDTLFQLFDSMLAEIANEVEVKLPELHQHQGTGVLPFNHL